VYLILASYFLLNITPAVTGAFVVSAANEKCVRVYGLVCARHCMILWGASPQYIVWRVVIIDHLKSTSRRQGRKGDRASERSPSENLRADEQKLHIKAEPQGESAQHDESHPDHRGRVNAAVVRPNEVTSALGV
jgi:hypothetical protein